MRARKFWKTLPMKLYLLLAAAVCLYFFANDFSLVDIQKTAIILAVGIDKAEGGFSVTAQIAAPKGTERTTGGTSSVEVAAEGGTVSDCISAIFAKTGRVPKLVFCNLIVLGEEAAKEDVIAHLNYFLRNDYMPDSCFLAVCEGSAGELISSQSAIDDASSLAIEKLFSDAAVKAGNVVSNTLKDFAIGYYGVSGSSFLPYIRTEEQEGGGNDSEEGAAASGGGEEAQRVYTATQTALFSKGKMVGLLSAEETLAYSLLEGNVFTGTFSSTDGEKPVTLTVMKNEGGVSLDEKKGEVKLELSLTVRLCCRGVTATVEDIASDSVSPEILQNAEKLLKGYTERLWETCKACGCDLFFLKRTLYRSSKKKFEEEGEGLLAALTPKIEADVFSMK